MAQIFYPATARATDSAGAPLNGAHWYFFGTGTLVAASAYQDAALVTPHAQPVVSDAFGKFPQIFLDPAVAYRAILKDGGNVITYDDLDPANVPDAPSVAAAASAQSAQDSADTATSAAAQATDAVSAIAGQTVNVSGVTFSPGELLADDEFADVNAWNLPAGWSFRDSTDGLVANTLGANRAIRSPNGDGTTSQASSAAFASVLIRVRPNRWYYAICDALYTSGYAGRARLRAQFVQRDGVTQTGSNVDTQGTDFRSVANGATAVEMLRNFSKAPSDAYYLRISPVANWPTTIPSAGFVYFAKPRVSTAKQSEGGVVSIGAPPATPYVISGGVITLDGSTSNVVIDTEAAASTDNLDTINGGEDGWIIVLRTTDSSRDVVVKDATGNINLPADQTLSTTADQIMLRCVGSSWLGISFSDNQ